MATVDASAYGAITSIVVSRGGEVVSEEYFEGHAATLRNTRSCTKTVASMLTGIAIERGIVSGVDASLVELLGADVDDLRKRGITVRDVLTMTSCLECNDWDETSPGNEERMYPRDDWVGFALGLPLREERGFSYCTAGVVALGVALERALGVPLPDFARRELFSPLGIEEAKWPKTPMGQVSTAGGLLLTSRSLLALGELYLRGGDGVVGHAWVEESIRPHARIDERTEYGYLWWLRRFGGEDCFYMTGMGGNRVHVFPRLELVAVITSSNFGRRDAHALSDRLLEEEILARAEDS
jgi:CubicO group peptidase (beta-lactamase class C family)